MPAYRKQDFPLTEIRRYLEPGPIVLLSSQWRGQTDIMTLGWHMMLEFTPALWACCISSANHSYALIRRSKQCVINLPTADMVDAVVGVGNSSGADVEKFSAFRLTPVQASAVEAPMIKECCAKFECRVFDASAVNKRGLFIFEVVKAHVGVAPRKVESLHYRGQGDFMVAGGSVSRRSRFKREYL